jgi:hypothetical protein
MQALDNPLSEFAQWALLYVTRGARVFPCKSDKTPLVKWSRDASADPETIRAWQTRWPFADVGIALADSVVVVDLDIKPGGRNGFKDFLTLEGRGALAVRTPTARTVSGGLHLFYRANGVKYRNAVRVGGYGFDLKCRGGYIIAPSGKGSGREWINPPEGPWEPAPAWLRSLNESVAARESNGRETRENAAQNQAIRQFAADSTSVFNPIAALFNPTGRYCGDTPHGLACLKGACADIRNASDGEQRFMLNRKGAKIGRLIAEGELGPHAADAVVEAALAMPDYDPKDPWRREELIERAREAVEFGMCRGQGGRR